MRILKYLTLVAGITLLGFAAPAVAQTVPAKSDEQISQEKSTRIFLDSRVSTILFSQTDRLSRPLGPLDDIETTQGTGVAELEGYNGPAWFSLSGRRSSLGGDDLDLGIVTIGGDIVSGPNGIFGIMLQNDFAFQDGSDGGTFDATGYMAGLYGIQQWAGLTVDARLLAGETSNDIANFGARADNVKSQRWLAAIQLLTTQELSDGLLLVPNGGVSWFEDRMDAYTLGITPVEAETIQYGQANLGAKAYVPITFGGAQGDIVIGGAGILGFGASAGEQVPDDLRGRVDLGIEFYNADVWQVSAGLFVDGLGQDEYEATGLDLGVTLWF